MIFIIWRSLNNFLFFAKKFDVQMIMGSWRGSIAHAYLWERIQGQAGYDLLGIYTSIDLWNLEEKKKSIRYFKI